MSEIRAGDLVMVVKGRTCCGYAQRLGTVFVVLDVKRNALCACDVCKDVSSEDVARMGGLLNNGLAAAVELSRLIRIDPPALPESIETDREVVA